MNTYSCKYCAYTGDKSSFFEHIRKSDCSDKRYEKKNESTLTETDITFGKYKDLKLSNMLRDRKYCQWLLEQDWFVKQYEYLYNRVKAHSPKKFFVVKPAYQLKSDTVQNFIDNYEYFHLCPLSELKIDLTDQEKICYSFYLETIENLKTKIMNNIGEKANIFDIKAPSKWLILFEKKTTLSRDIFKEFLSAHELPNITSLVEDIKKMGGIEYKGAKSFLIAKEKSLKQEKYWEDILKTFYGQDIGVQFKYKKCIFDFINTKLSILYECKLGLKDFDKTQYNKYLATLGTYTLIYLIGNDCVIDLSAKTIFTTNTMHYKAYLLTVDNPTDFEKIVQTFSYIEVKNITDYFKNDFKML